MWLTEPRWRCRWSLGSAGRRSPCADQRTCGLLDVSAEVPVRRAAEKTKTAGHLLKPAEPTVLAPRVGQMEKG
jgi:hypothetical protein